MPRTTANDLLAPTEWKVFYAVSQRREPLSVREIEQELGRIDAAVSWGTSTVQTLLKRLVEKGFLKREDVFNTPSRPTPVYKPAIPYEEALRLHTLRFRDQFALGGKRDVDRVSQFLRENP